MLPFAVIAGGFKIAEEILNAVEKALVLTAQIVAANRDDTTELCLTSVRDEVVSIKGDTVILKGEFDGPDGAIFKLQVDVDDLQVKAGQMNDASAEIKAELALMKIVLEANHELLLTPPGRRNGFNKP